MGYKVQVHKKANKRGTWAYHSIDGWSLSTSQEHYQTHVCQIKHTNSDRLSDTVQFKHKHITNPLLTHAKKIMRALSHCIQVLKGKEATTTEQELRDIQQVIDATQAHLDTNKASLPRMQPHQHTMEQQNQTAPRVQKDTALRVPATTAMLKPSIADAQQPRRKQKRKESGKAMTSNLNQPRTRLQAVQETRQATPPAINTQSKKGASNRFQQMENEVQRGLAVMDKETGQLRNYRQLIQNPKYKKDWNILPANEFVQLAQGVGGRIKGTNTIKFIYKQKVPQGKVKDVTYGQFVCTERPEKKEKNRTRFTIGGNQINYPGEVATPTADLLVSKILFNSTISTPGAKLMTMDISNFYLNLPLPRPEYIRIKISNILEEIINKYQLREKASETGHVYIKANKGMYGLPQAGLIANKLLEQKLSKHEYRQSRIVPGLWKHNTRPIQFTLVVDDFGVKYVGKEHAIHLQKVLNEHCKLKCDWTGKRYIGITLDGDYKRRQVHLSMPGYVKKALKQLCHEMKQQQYSPYPCATIKYGATKQYATTESAAPQLDAQGKRFIQQLCRKFLYLGRAVDSTLLCPIRALASQSSTSTEDTMRYSKQLLDYLGTQEEAVLTFNASSMVLAMHSDASYLSEPKTSSRADGHFFLSDNTGIPANNGAILNIAHIIKHVMSLATEAELAALYIMAK